MSEDEVSMTGAFFGGVLDGGKFSLTVPPGLNPADLRLSVSMASSAKPKDRDFYGCEEMSISSAGGPIEAVMRFAGTASS